MSLAENFAAAYRRCAAASPAWQLVPDQLASAITDVVDVDGVGLGVFDGAGLAVPIGASCDKTALAERLQYTTGQGPCYDAHRGSRTVVAIEPVMATSWPAYHDLLVTQTLFRSVIALPLTGPLDSMITIDLLFHDPQAAAAASLADVAMLCRLVTAALIEADLIATVNDTDAAAASSTDEGGGPVWLSSPRSAARYQVIVAAGMLTRYLDISMNAAVKVLKARAYAQHSTTDDVAAALVHGELPPSTFAMDT